MLDNVSEIYTLVREGKTNRFERLKGDNRVASSV
jgi:hypothetical protein